MTVIRENFRNPSSARNFLQSKGFEPADIEGGYWVRLTPKGVAKARFNDQGGVTVVVEEEEGPARRFLVDYDTKNPSGARYRRQVTLHMPCLPRTSTWEAAEIAAFQACSKNPIKDFAFERVVNVRPLDKLNSPA